MANVIRMLRKAKGISQTALAEAAGITRPYLSDIERNISNPTVEVAARICRVLDEPFEKVFSPEPQRRAV